MGQNSRQRRGDRKKAPKAKTGGEKPKEDVAAWVIHAENVNEAIRKEEARQDRLVSAATSPGGAVMAFFWLKSKL